MKAFSFLVLCIFFNAINASGQEYESVTPLLKLDSVRSIGGGAQNNSVSFKYLLGKIIEEKHYAADPHSTNDPVYFSNNKYFYNSNNTLKYILDRVSNLFSSYDSIYYSYNTSNLVSEILIYTKSRTKTELYKRHNYYYDFNNRIDSIIEFDDVNNQWEILNKTIYSYRTDGKLIKSSSSGEVTFYFYNTDGSFNYNMVYNTTDTLFSKPKSKTIHFPNGQLVKDVISYDYVNDTTQYVIRHNVYSLDTSIKREQMYLPIWYNENYKLTKIDYYLGSASTNPLVTSTYFYTNAAVGVDLNNKIPKASILTPNPFSCKLFINEGVRNNTNVKLFNAQGLLIYEGTDRIIDTEYLSNGVYFYQLVDNGEVIIGKLIK